MAVELAGLRSSVRHEQRRSRAAACRARAKARAFWRGVRCAAGPPGFQQIDAHNSSSTATIVQTVLPQARAREDVCDPAPSSPPCLAVKPMSTAEFLRISKDIKLRIPHIRSARTPTAAPTRVLAIADKRYPENMPIDEFLRVSREIKRRLPCWRNEWSAAAVMDKRGTTGMLAITDATESTEEVRSADLAAGLVEDLRQQTGTLASLVNNTLTRFEHLLRDEEAVTRVTTRAAHALEWLLDNDMASTQPSGAPLGEGTTIVLTQWCRDMDEHVLLDLVSTLLSAPD